MQVRIRPAQHELVAIWLEYQTQFYIVQQLHKQGETVMPAEMLQRYNAEMVGTSRAELALREGALAAAKIKHSELERLRKDDNLTGNRHTYKVHSYVHKHTTAPSTDSITR